MPSEGCGTAKTPPDAGARAVRAGAGASSVRPPMVAELDARGFGGLMPHHGCTLRTTRLGRSRIVVSGSWFVRT